MGCLRQAIFSINCHRLLCPPPTSLRTPDSTITQDVGGVPGYAHFLEAIGDPTHEDHDHFLEWCGGSFDPATFDLVVANQRLSEIKC
ncbi:hypothetical protein [Pandoraea sp.]|uniref:IS1096 element passenger TnpR family protein n=1 Tax=Pandoraea sp. TaxID=1883445 RepID=UPI0025E2CFC6|nr:hypothetical protein [Pandoraea sp.]